MATTGAATIATVTTRHLIVGRAAWWIAAPDAANAAATQRDEDTQKLPFAAGLKDLLQNLSFHCYGKLVEHGRRYQERLFWLIFHITALIVLTTFLWRTYKHESRSLVTTIHDPLYPIWKVPFPAISICSLNRISKLKVWQYAQELKICQPNRLVSNLDRENHFCLTCNVSLGYIGQQYFSFNLRPKTYFFSDKDPQHVNASFFYEKLQLLGLLYNRPDELGAYRSNIRFQAFLDNYDTEPEEFFFNTRTRMHSLTPNCSQQLVSCRMGGKPFECAKEFKETLTPHGFCCTFNIDGRYVRSQNWRRRYYGAEMGLVLTLNTTSEDDFFKLFPLDGFIISIYMSHSYPDLYSGGVAERFASTGLNTLLPVRTQIFETVPEARYMSPTERNCLFEDEMPRVFKSRYTFSKCISACRASSVLSLCECVPFTVPDNYFAGAAGRAYCTLQHMECLKRYEFKWLNVITSRANVTGLEHEMQDALYCPDCLPSCTETRYNVRGAMTLALGAPHKPLALKSGSGNIDGNNSYDAELAVVRIYFAETHIQYFRQIIENAWYQTFSTIGNICGIIAGFSLIGICELLFFLVKQLFYACKAEVKAEYRQARANDRAKAEQQQQQRLEQQQMKLLILP